ncbi:hypothetical protein CW304_19040 [Bacillus sp. UFRGS-B20]|nr:hypothetical protein CW304_19040 [Bacillus sp. UFRGS-B20]
MGCFFLYHTLYRCSSLEQASISLWRRTNLKYQVILPFLINFIYNTIKLYTFVYSFVSGYTEAKIIKIYVRIFGSKQTPNIMDFLFGIDNKFVFACGYCSVCFLFVLSLH